jgi:DDE superfamily endonuclease
MDVHASTVELPEWQELLGAFQIRFRRPEGRKALERYTTGLLTELPYKNCDTLAQAVPGSSEPRLQEFLTNMPWDEEDLHRQRVRKMIAEATRSAGVLVFDDTGFPKQGTAADAGACGDPVSDQARDGADAPRSGAGVGRSPSWCRGRCRLWGQSELPGGPGGTAGSACGRGANGFPDACRAGGDQSGVASGSTAPDGASLAVAHDALAAPSGAMVDHHGSMHRALLTKVLTIASPRHWIGQCRPSG